MENHNWSEFKIRIPIRADKKVIFDYLSIQDNIEKWFLSLAEFYDSQGETRNRNYSVEKGDKYKWMWHGSNDVAEGEIFEVNPDSHLKFSFLGCIVNVTIKDEEGETMVELVQSEIPLDDNSKKSLHVGCTRGWTFYLTNLKSILEGGIDLRNKNVNLVDVLNT